MIATAHPTPSPSSPNRVVWLLAALVAVSTALAFTSHAMFGAPGDHPLFLLVTGCGLAFAVGGLRLARPLVAGGAALAGFPIAALVDLLLHGGHNLLPIEFAIYAMYGGLGVVAATIGAACRRPPR